MRHLIGFSLFLGLANGLTYSIDTKNGPISVVSDSFLSVGLNIEHIYYSPINLSNPKFVKLAKHLAPIYLRIGGPAVDTVVFQDDTKDGLIENYNTYGRGVLLASRWRELNKFVKEANARLFFNLNSLTQRKGDDSWNPENAEQLIKFSRENGFELDWELGYEPDQYNVLVQYVSPAQLGKDYGTLRSLLDQYGYNSSYLVGPGLFDVGSSDSKDYLRKFLSVASPSINAATWHQYDSHGKRLSEDLFLNSATFNSFFEQRTKVVTNIVGSANKVWLGEASPTNSRAADKFTNKYIASFLWADKLGLGAKLGLEVIVRNDIWGYNYGLLDSEFNPNPDWWVSILHKKLVGTKVISLTNDGKGAQTIRLYAHCAKSNALWGDNAVVVFGVNIANKIGSFNISNDLKASKKVYFYEITAGEGTLYTNLVRLNGAILKLSEDVSLPEIDPQIVEFSNSYSMPSYSIGFWVFTDTNVKACQ